MEVVGIGVNIIHKKLTAKGCHADEYKEPMFERKNECAHFFY